MGLVAIPKKPTIKFNRDGFEVYIYTEDTNKLTFELYLEGTMDLQYGSEPIQFIDFQSLEIQIVNAINYVNSAA